MIEMPEMNTELQMVNAHIDRLCQSNSESMQKLLDWVLSARGKQICPLLTLICERLNGKSVDVTEIAAIIEMCHTASLIHDDIIDEADTRRGQLSVQKKFGREMAVYAGDFMIFAAISRTGIRKKHYYSSIFEQLERMCDGEVSQFEHRFDIEISEEKYIENIIGKTSAMFCIACEAGAYEGKCSDNEISAIKRYAENFGLIFQLRDDLMDFLPTGDLPGIHTFSDCRYGAELRKIAMDIKNGLYSELADNRIAELISASDGFQYTLRIMDEYAKEAKQGLDVFKDSTARQKLLELVETVRLNAHKIVSDYLSDFP